MRVDGPWSQPSIYLVLLFLGMIIAPCALYFYLAHPDWSWLYLVDSTRVPRLAVILVMAAQAGVLVGAYYGYNQNSYGKTPCSNRSAGTCSGKYQVGSLLVNYRLTKRFDVYLGGMYSTASDGPSSGFLNTNTLATTAGLRFKF